LRTSAHGLTRRLIVEVPTRHYTTDCKPGMVGRRHRAPFTVTGSETGRWTRTARMAERPRAYKR